MMLSQICQELRNWFDRNQPKWHGKITLHEDGSIDYEGGSPITLKDGQFFRVVGSVFNDGVYRYPAYDLYEETFTGSIWAMAVPPAVIVLCEEIEDWQKRYGGVDGVLMSPYQSESFGGYSYSKSGGGAGDGRSSAGTWKGAFATRLNAWRKI